MAYSIVGLKEKILEMHHKLTTHLELKDVDDCIITNFALREKS